MIFLQWFLCLFTTQLNIEVIETIWDFLFLEGTVVLFRITFGILSMMEDELLDTDEFGEIYALLNTQPRELLFSPYAAITLIKRFSFIKEIEINQLRNSFRPMIKDEQTSIWIGSSRSKAPREADAEISK